MDDQGGLNAWREEMRWQGAITDPRAQALVPSEQEVAAAYAKTMAGQIRRLTEAFAILRDHLVETIIPTFERFADWGVLVDLSLHRRVYVQGSTGRRYRVKAGSMERMTVHVYPDGTWNNQVVADEITCENLRRNYSTAAR